MALSVSSGSTVFYGRKSQGLKVSAQRSPERGLVGPGIFTELASKPIQSISRNVCEEMSYHFVRLTNKSFHSHLRRSLVKTIN